MFTTGANSLNMIPARGPQTGFLAYLALQSLLCNPCHAMVEMQSFLFNPCYAVSAMQSLLRSLLCKAFYASFAMKSLLCNLCYAIFTVFEGLSFAMQLRPSGLPCFALLKVALCMGGPSGPPMDITRWGILGAEVGGNQQS